MVELSSKLKEAVRSELRSLQPSGRRSPFRVTVGAPVIGEEETLAALEAIASAELSSGQRVERFEQQLAAFVGSRRGVAVNSGSSANFLIFAALRSSLIDSRLRIRSRFEVITSATTWPTTISPILQFGGTPVFVDIDPETYCLDADLVAKAKSRTTRVVLPVHLLGCPADLPALSELCDSRDWTLVEDCCEALGAAVNRRRVGGWGVASSFSFFVSHHMTTGEGGMVVTRDDTLAEAARSLRAFGRAGEPVKDRLRKVTGLGDYDLRYVFSELGYSMKMTEFQAAMGSEQLRKLETFVETRRRYSKRLRDGLHDFERWLQLPQEPNGAYHSYFGFPILIKKSSNFHRSELTNFLESRGIETRPIMAGNIVEHPCMKGSRYRVIGALRHSRMIARSGFFVGCHPALAEQDIDFVIECFREFFKGRRP